MVTSRELFLSRLRCEHTEDVPIFLRDLTLALDVINARTTDVFTEDYDSKLSAKAVVAFQRHTGQDAVVGCIQSAAFNVESFGGVMKYPEYGIPIPVIHPFENITDVPDVNIGLSKKMLGAVSSYSIVRKDLPDVAVVANVEGPLTKTGTLTGMERLAMLLIDDRDTAGRFIDAAMEHTCIFVEELERNDSIDTVFIAAATDNPDLFGDTAFSEFTLSHVREFVRKMHDSDLPVIFHPHGVFSSDGASEILEESILTGIDGFQFAEDNDPAVITSKIDGRCAVLGGTDIVPTLLHGSNDTIRNETEYHLNACRSGNHIFMPSCSLHRGSDINRIMVMMDAVRSFKDNAQV